MHIREFVIQIYGQKVLQLLVPFFLQAWNPKIRNKSDTELHALFGKT